MTTISKRSITAAALTASAFALLATSGTAQAGFLDQLFGAPPAPATPSYSYEQPSAPVDLARPQVRSRRHSMVMPTHLRQPKKVVASRDLEKPVLQQTTDLMSDKTLRPGDAVMMKDGLRVYDGREASNHRATQFVALDAAKLKAPERSALVAMDTTRNDPLRGTVTPDTVASGRSAAVGAPVVKGFKITDARGQSVRYVGP